MKTLLLWAYFFFWDSREPDLVKEIEVPQIEQDLNMALPGQVQPAVEMQRVNLEIDADGKVSAVVGDDKLAAFDPGQAGKMKPLDDWLTKVGKKGKPLVWLKVDINAAQQSVAGVLNVLATQGITEITFTDEW